MNFSQTHLVILLVPWKQEWRAVRRCSCREDHTEVDCSWFRQLVLEKEMMCSSQTRCSKLSKSMDFNFSVFWLSPLKLGQSPLHSSCKHLQELIFVEQPLLKVHNRNVHKDPASKWGTICCKQHLALWKQWKQGNLRQLCDSFPQPLNCPDAPLHFTLRLRPSCLLVAAGIHSCVPSPHCASSSLRPWQERRERRFQSLSIHSDTFTGIFIKWKAFYCEQYISMCVSKICDLVNNIG